MKTLHVLTVVLALTTLFCASTSKAQQVKEDRIKASYYYAFGRLPEPAELADWMKKPDLTIAQIVETHKGFLRSNAIERDHTVAAATKAAWGLNDNSTTWTVYGPTIGKEWNTFTELVKVMVRKLDSDKAFKDKIISDSYNAVNLKYSEQDIWGW